MDFIFASMKKDLLRWWQDRTSLLIWMGIPLLVGGLIMSLVGGGNAGKPTGVLLIVDQDQSFLSGLVGGAFSQGAIGELIVIEQVPLEEGTARIAADDASGLLVIPDGFAEAFLDDTPVTLTLSTNPSQAILPGIIRDVTEILLDAGFYAQQLFGDEIGTIRDSGLDGLPQDAIVADLAVRIQGKVDSLAPKLFPPVIDIDIVEPPPTDAPPDIALLFVPGIVLMAILFASNSLAADYWRERDTGTLRRLVAAPGKLNGLVAGKALAVAVVMAILATFTLSLAFVYHDLAWSKLPSSIVWVSISGVAIYAWFAVLQTLFATRKAASLLSTLLIFPLLMAGGSFFPLAALPDWIAFIGRLSPNGFVADRLTVELTAAGAWSYGIGSWTIVLAMLLGGLSICAWRLNSGFAGR